MRFGVEHPAVTGVFFQPVTHGGRHPSFDPLDRLTNVEVIRALCDQLPGWFREDDFVAVPCCSPTCRSATYALYDGEDLVPLPRLVDVDRYLDYVTNRAVPDLEVKAALEGLFSASAAGGTERTGERLECVACGSGCPPSCATSRPRASWSSSRAGFTTGRPWLPIPPEAEHASVAAQDLDPDSMLSLYRGLIALRKRHSALRRGGYRSQSAPADVLAYRRTDRDGDVLVALNFAGEERPLPDAFRGVPLLSSDPRRTEGAALRLAPYEGLVLAAP